MQQKLKPLVGASLTWFKPPTSPNRIKDVIEALGTTLCSSEESYDVFF